MNHSILRNLHMVQGWMDEINQSSCRENHHPSIEDKGGYANAHGNLAAIPLRYSKPCDSVVFSLEADKPHILTAHVIHGGQHFISTDRAFTELYPLTPHPYR